MTHNNTSTLIWRAIDAHQQKHKSSVLERKINGLIAVDGLLTLLNSFEVEMKQTPVDTKEQFTSAPS